MAEQSTPVRVDFCAAGSGMAREGRHPRRNQQCPLRTTVALARCPRSRTSRDQRARLPRLAHASRRQGVQLLCRVNRSGASSDPASADCAGRPRRGRTPCRRSRTSSAPAGRASAALDGGRNGTWGQRCDGPYGECTGVAGRHFEWLSTMFVGCQGVPNKWISVCR